MRNDSIESLLLRHYGDDAPAPVGLETRLLAAVRQEAALQERHAPGFGEQRISRRKAVRWVALGTAGLSIVSMGMEGLQMLETALTGQDVTQPAYP